MAFSPAPSISRFPSSATTPSQSLFQFHPRTQISRILTVGNIKISCCQQTIQPENETKDKAILARKKRKPRPSFLEQVQNKWSVKTPSLRENFPWQEQDNGDKNDGFQAQRSRDVSSEKESEEDSSVSEEISSHTTSKSVLAPWAHGKESRKKLFNSEGTRQSREMDQAIEGFHESCPNEVPLLKKVTFDGKIEGKSGEFNKIRIGLPERNEILGDEGKHVTFKEYSSRIYSEDSNKKYSPDKNDLNRLPWEKKIADESVKEEKLRRTNTELAERLIPESELKRLRNVSLRMMERINVGAAGVTQQLIDSIHEKWKDDEVVKLKFEGPPSKNMKRTHEILESRSGGLIIWRSGSSVVLYRGMSYNLDCVKSYSKNVQTHDGAAQSSNLHKSEYYNSLSEEEQMDLSELDLLLDDLGPRFVDWSGRDPVPVDADLLPAVVPGYKTPFRLLPHGTRHALRDQETTFLRRTARTMPPHFALGRSRELQGLAMAMVKLWEKCAIVKIAIKRGVLNTSNERIAEELKILTGGTLLSRNKEFIVFYRGNDFLPPNVSSALKEAEKYTATQQDEEEWARHRAAMLIDTKSKSVNQPFVAGTLAETVAATSKWGNQSNGPEIEKMMKDDAVAKHRFLLNALQRKLALAKGKMKKAENSLQKVLENQEPENLPTDLETLTDEERFLFRRIGLRMKPYLVLGRREIFDGTIENMHLHWKYRELVKIMVERRTFSQVRHIAISLEAESGGVLVSIERTGKGYVIIVYRGKNYRPPLQFRPKTLLTKRQALSRSIELQRREGLKHHILELEEKIEKTKLELENMMAANDDVAETMSNDVAQHDDQETKLDWMMGQV